MLGAAQNSTREFLFSFLCNFALLLFFEGSLFFNNIIIVTKRLLQYSGSLEFVYTLSGDLGLTSLGFFCDDIPPFFSKSLWKEISWI